MDIKYVLFILSSLIIFSYIFDAIAQKTKFPSVILLMATGIAARAISDGLGYKIMYLDQIIPVMGTIGLILIVLEGALELKVNKQKLKVIFRGFMAALVILIANVVGLTLFFQDYLELSNSTAVMNAIPLAIISSAVAIPSASALLPMDKEFIVYESTFSDILGIMMFNYSLKQFTAGEELLGLKPLALLMGEIGGIVLASIVITWLLFELFERLEKKIKFFLILALLIMAYAIGKTYHLPSLVIIFVFGIVLSNADFLLPNFIKRFVSMSMAREEGLHEFHILTAESTFLVRTFFFLFFGFSITIDSFTEGFNYIYAGIILGVMLLMRLLYMGVVERKSIQSLVFISPRGLISILLFLQLQRGGEYAAFGSPLINSKVLLLVILGSMLIMTIGTLLFAGSKKEPEAKSEGSTAQLEDPLITHATDGPSADSAEV
ncbi:cation:proton antiporter [Chitinophagales bacterium]|nr:cation:proton antiporter [Chitinophagales bacterium]